MNRPVDTLLGVRVLLVDDDDDTRDVFGFALRGAGADVHTARDAKDAMVTIRQWVPSIVVSDLAMPRTDGFTLLREIHALYPFHEVAAIAVSGLDVPNLREAVFAAGFQMHVTKPLNPEKLVALVRELAHRREVSTSEKGP